MAFKTYYVCISFIKEKLPKESLPEEGSYLFGNTKEYQWNFLNQMNEQKFENII